jgi:hypothetical protein
MTIHNAGVAGHTFHSKLVDEDPVAVEWGLSAARLSAGTAPLSLGSELPSWPARRPRTGCWDTFGVPDTENPPPSICA